jgi:hypothetical protein
VTAAELDALLGLIGAEPTLLDPAPAYSREALEARVAEGHVCLRCGAASQAAFIVWASAGGRWLDLCMACAFWLRDGLQTLWG